MHSTQVRNHTEPRPPVRAARNAFTPVQASIVCTSCKLTIRCRHHAVALFFVCPDSWGQSIEATEQYEKLNRMLEMQIPELQLNAEEKVRNAGREG